MPPVVLDISRSISRVSSFKLTGIDRVELAYIAHFLEWPEPVFFLARFRNQNALLDRAGMRELFRLIQNNGPWDPRDLKSRLRLRHRPFAAKVETTIRRLALSSQPMVQGLQKHVPKGFTYLNVGHGAMHPKNWVKLRQANVGKIAILVHDVIPLDYPEYCSPKTTKQFAQRLRAAAENSDIIIYNSTDTKNRTEHWLQKWDCQQTNGHVALLGTDPLPLSNADVASDHPYFVILGTIEPRKNHKLLFKIWDQFHKTLPLEDIPHLYIIGARGWLNEDVFQTLDSAEFMDETVFEMGRLSDEETGKLLANAKALLFPSFAEGFGYPLVEAMQLATPVICSNLPSFFELAEGYATFLDPNETQDWHETIISVSTQNSIVSTKSAIVPTWSEHFRKLNIILA